MIGALCLAALATIAAGLAPWTFSKTALIDAISGEIYGSSGLYVAVKGQTALSLLPRPRIVVEGVALADPSAFAMLEAERLSGDLRLFPLLTGRIEFGRITLARALVTIDLGKASGAAPLAAASRPRAAPTARLGDVSLIDATVRMRDGEKVVSLENLWASLESRGPAAPATLRGAFDWRGERMEGFLWVARPEAIPHGDTTPLSFRLDGPSLTIEAEGMAQSDVKPRFVGRVTASAPSLRQAFAMFDLSPPLPGPFDNFRLAATASLEPDSIQLSQLRFSADNNDFDGAADLRRAQNVDLVEHFRVEREDAFDALPEAHLAHGEAALRATAHLDDDAFERLQALFFAFLDPDLYANRVAGTEAGEICALRLGKQLRNNR